MDHKCTVELKGHIFESLKLTSVLDEIIDSGSICKIKDIKVGTSKTEESYARIKIRSESKKILDDLLKKLKKYGVVPVKILSKTIEVQGHIVDSLTLPKILDIIYSNDVRSEIQDIRIGIEKKDFSYAKIKLFASDPKIMDDVLNKLKQHGAVVEE